MTLLTTDGDERRCFIALGKAGLPPVEGIQLEAVDPCWDNGRIQLSSDDEAVPDFKVGVAGGKVFVQANTVRFVEALLRAADINVLDRESVTLGRIEQVSRFFQSLRDTAPTARERQALKGPVEWELQQAKTTVESPLLGVTREFD
jgi:hypothetical protein